MTDVEKNILIAEDNPVLSRIMEFNLQKAGYFVTIVNNGNDAAALLKQETFDLLVTDYQMPGQDGAALCDFVRGYPETAHLPIILCTAKGLELKPDELTRQWNLVSVFFKPFSMTEIVKCIREHFASTDAAENSTTALTP